MLHSALATAAVLSVFPLGVEIDCSNLPVGMGITPPYKFTLTLKVASGHRAELPLGIAAGTPDDAAYEFDFWLRTSGRWEYLRVGRSVFVYGRADSPVTAVTVEGNGPKPAVRWVPRRK